MLMVLLFLAANPTPADATAEHVAEYPDMKSCNMGSACNNICVGKGYDWGGCEPMGGINLVYCFCAIVIFILNTCIVGQQPAACDMDIGECINKV